MDSDDFLGTPWGGLKKAYPVPMDSGISYLPHGFFGVGMAIGNIIEMARP